MHLPEPMQRASRALFSALLVSTGLCAGCARGPIVSSDLPLKRVVIYRNGVGYFERSGHVDAEQVSFKMRAHTVGDFLSTLAIVERGGSSVKSASFPLDIVDETAGPPPEPPPEPRAQPRAARKPVPNPPEKKRPDRNGLREVLLHLDGKEHDLAIGYVAETPVWRPSYRLVVSPGGQATLQTWGIVQNLSGEDWKNVELVLVAGAPIAFQSTLGEPIVPERPVVTDSGEVIAAVPGAVTTLAEQPAPEAQPAPPPAEGAAAAEDEALADGEAPEESAHAGRAKKKPESPAAQRARLISANAGTAAAPKADDGRPGGKAVAAISAPRKISALAAVAVEGATTRYELPGRVTVPDESATMVLLLNSRIPGEAVYLFAPDQAVTDSFSHPFRVVRFRNMTRGLLERGPIAVFEKGSFLGEGLLDPLPPRATATVPFALERGLAVESSRKEDQEGARLHRIEAGTLFVERDQVHQTIYTVKNGTPDTARLLVQHPRIAGSRLHAPPPGTEDNTGTGYALVPVDVPSQRPIELLVDERSEFQMPVDWLSDVADVAVRAFLAAPYGDPKSTEQLRIAWELRNKLRTLTDEHRRLTIEQGEIEKASNDTRLSLKAIEKNKQAADLRAKLTQRLTDLTQRMDGLTKRLVEVKMAVDEQQVRFEDAIRDLKIAQPPTRKAG